MIPQMGQQSVQLTHLFEQKSSSFFPARSPFRMILNAQKFFLKTIYPILFHDYPCLPFGFLKGDKDCPNFNSVEIDWNWD
jgi:hypothetical protein